MTSLMAGNLAPVSGLMPPSPNGGVPALEAAGDLAQKMCRT